MEDTCLHWKGNQYRLSNRTLSKNTEEQNYANYVQVENGDFEGSA